MAPIATSQRLRAFNKDLGCMVDVKIRWLKLFCKRRSLVIELSKTFTFAPKPMAVFAANSPTVPAPRITTSVGGTPVMFPNKSPFPNSLAIINSAAIKIDAVPAISLKDLTAG
ncbi:hypothetical protein D3C85_1322360 [compost metagenome]